MSSSAYALDRGADNNASETHSLKSVFGRKMSLPLHEWTAALMAWNTRANKQPKTNTIDAERVAEMYLEASRIDDANDTGICDAVHNVEPKVGTRSRECWNWLPMHAVRAGICSTAETRL